MEHTHKSLATASCEGQGASPGSIIDRFSDLPDEIAHHILSFVHFKELIRVGCVSKRWRGLYLSTTSLKIDSRNGGNKQGVLNRLNAFDRFLHQRGDNKIKHCKIHLNLISGLRNEIFRMMRWVHIATRCNVEVLDLYWSIHKTYDRVVMELPSCVIMCRSLRSLSVAWSVVLKVPSVTGFTNLQSLKLICVSIDEGFCKWISSTCKCIKELQFHHVRAEKITIESMSLESFALSYGDQCHLSISGEKLERINIKWESYKPGSRSLSIFAPNLKYFKWSGNIPNHQSLGNLASLEKAEIFLLPAAYGFDFHGFDNAFEFLSSICRVKVLILSDKTTKLLFNECSMPPEFDNISYLGMQVESISNDLVPAMVSLLRGMPNLNTLRIETDALSQRVHTPRASRFNRKYWKSQNLNFASHLKDVTIELSNGYNGMELARYIVEQSQSLEQMILFYLPKQPYVIKRVTQSKMVSNSTASIVFHIRYLR